MIFSHGFQAYFFWSSILLAQTFALRHGSSYVDDEGAFKDYEIYVSSYSSTTKRLELLG